MRRFLYQYLVMGISLALMFAATAYLRGAASVIYLSQLATFLIMLNWSSPFEVSIGNLIFKKNHALPRQQRAKLSRFDSQIILRVILISGGFCVFFAIYPGKDAISSIDIAVGIGILFLFRFIEYASRINLLLLGLGQIAQIIVNLFTALKWLAAWLLYIIGLEDFKYFILSQVALSLISSSILVRMRFNQVGLIPAADEKSDVHIRDDVLSLISVGLGVFSFQLDKIAVGLLENSSDFGQYVLLCTLLFIGPYVLSPVFSIFQQHFVAVSTDKTNENKTGASVVRVFALLVTAFSLPFLIVINFIHPGIASGFAQVQIGIISLASYLNCVTHIQYLRYQTNGNVRLIMFQNLTGAICASLMLTVIIIIEGRWYSLVLLAAAFGQYLFGVAREYSLKTVREKLIDVIGPALLIPYLMIRYWNEHLNAQAFCIMLFAMVVVIMAGIGTEAWTLHRSMANHFNQMRKFLQQR